MGLAPAYIRWVERFSHLVLVWWFCWLVFGGVFGLRLLDVTTSTFNAPSDSLATQAQLAFATPFPQMSAQADLIVFLTNTAGQDIRSEAVQNFSYYLNSTLCNDKKSDIQSITSYYLFQKQGVPPTALDRLISEDNTSTIIDITLSLAYSSQSAKDFAAYLQNVINEYPLEAVSLKAQITGIPAFLKPILSAAENDLEHMDVIVMPISMSVLCFLLQSVRLMIIPTLAMAVAALTTFVCMWLIALRLDVISFVPSLMMSLLVAMSIDYSLFLLSRYREALLAGVRGKKAVTIMIKSAGHTILVSGATLCFCFLGLMLIPIDLIRSTGVGCALSVGTAFAVNLTLTPVLLLTFPNFFERCIEPWPWSKERYAGASNNFESSESSTNRLRQISEEMREELSEESNYSSTNNHYKAGHYTNGLLDAPLLLSSREQEEMEIKSTAWYKLGGVVLSFPVNVIVVVVIVALMVPFAMKALSFAVTDSMLTMMPRGGDATESLIGMTNAFGTGILYPYNILVSGPSRVDVMSEEYFTVTNALMLAMLKNPNLKETYARDFTGITFANSLPTPREYIVNCLSNHTFNALCPALLLSYNQYVSHIPISSSSNRTLPSSYIMFTASFDPIGISGAAWLNEARRTVTVWESQHKGYTAQIAGVAADTFDAITASYAEFPLMAGITCLAILLLVGFAFKSIMVPLRALFTTAVTLSFVYGFADMTYEYGALNWTGLKGLQSTQAVFWLIPLLSFCIIIGIGLDYDIFLLVRVHEYWMEGYTLRESLLRGLSKTGHIISAAGVIMAIAFSGLLFSSQPAVNQLAFFLVVSVLFDTFIVRPIMVPALMILLRRASFWPSKQPIRRSHRDRGIKRPTSYLERQHTPKNLSPKIQNAEDF